MGTYSLVSKVFARGTGYKTFFLHSYLGVGKNLNSIGWNFLFLPSEQKKRGGGGVEGSWALTAWGDPFTSQARAYEPRH